jgi:hypothetical protein
MVITRHTGINRHGYHERPVTVIDDDGRIFDTVLLFKNAPSVPNIEEDAIAYVNRIKNSQTVDETTIVAVSDVETVLRRRGVLGETERWADYSAPYRSIPRIEISETIERRA